MWRVIVVLHMYANFLEKQSLSSFLHSIVRMKPVRDTNSEPGLPVIQKGMLSGPVAVRFKLVRAFQSSYLSVISGTDLLRNLHIIRCVGLIITWLSEIVVLTFKQVILVLILVHSFIRRLHKFIEHHLRDVDLSLQITAPADITWHGIGGRTVAKTIKFDLHVVRSTHPDVVIVQLGSCLRT